MDRRARRGHRGDRAAVRGAVVDGPARTGPRRRRLGRGAHRAVPARGGRAPAARGALPRPRHGARRSSPAFAPSSRAWSLPARSSPRSEFRSRSSTTTCTAPTSSARRGCARRRLGRCVRLASVRDAHDHVSRSSARTPTGTSTGYATPTSSRSGRRRRCVAIRLRVLVDYRRLSRPRVSPTRPPTARTATSVPAM